MMKPEPAPCICSCLLPKRRRNSRPSGVSFSSGGSSAATSLPVTVSVTAMFTTAGSTRLTSGEKLSGAERAAAPCGAAVQAATKQQGEGRQGADLIPHGPAHEAGAACGVGHAGGVSGRGAAGRA